jgi:outer membrane protein TolC
VQDFNLYQTQISKRTATGSALSLRNNTTYDANNAPGNLFPSAWDTNVEAEIRQPLLQGAGTFFNRVAGPGSAPGLYNGVLIAKVSRDMSLTEFEVGLRDYVSNLENAYWDLYFAYRDLDAKKTARDESLRTWQIIRARLKQRGFEADKEAQAREQYYRFQQEVQDALSGRVQDGTRTYNGSNGGTFRRTVGVHVAERRLRLLLGWPINGESLIRPATEPVHAAVKYDWDAILAESLARRTELRRQRQQVKQRELQLSASRSFLKPQFDAVGRYRWRGFGSNLLSVNRESERFGNAVQNLTSGDFQEWQMGFEFSIPLGFRQAHAAVRNAELRLARERAILREQERQVVYHLSNAIEDVDRAYRDVQLGYNRLRAAKTRVDSLKSVDETSSIATPDQLLEAHNRLADAESRYYMSLVEYMIAVRNVHFEKGSLFDYHSIQLQDAHGHGDGYNGLRNFEFRSAPMFESPGELPGDFPGEPPGGLAPPQADPNGVPPAPSPEPTAGRPSLISPASGSATLPESRNDGSADSPPSGNGESPARRVIKGPALAPASPSSVSPIFTVVP